MSQTEAIENMTRAEKRRLWKSLNKKDDYEASRFLDFSDYQGVVIKASKYVPHIGKKQRAKANG